MTVPPAAAVAGTRYQEYVRGLAVNATADQQEDALLGSESSLESVNEHLCMHRRNSRVHSKSPEFLVQMAEKILGR